jgi:hypothetical protein
VRRFDIMVPGRPVSKNGMYVRRALGRGRGLRFSDAARDFFKRVQNAAVWVLGHERCPLDRNVAIVVTSHFTRPADSGASLALVKDALQGLIYANDSCVVLEASWQGNPRPADPFTLISIWELDPADCRVRLPIPPDCAFAPGQHTRTWPSSAADLETRKGSDVFERRARLVSSKRDHRADAWEDGHEPTRIPDGF